MKNPTTVERKSERELVVTRTFDAPPHAVWRAWAERELFEQWWVPKSCGLTMTSCAMDVREGGSYRLTFVFGDEPSAPMEVFGRYVVATPPSRLVWTNDEGDGQVITTVTLDDDDGKTHLVMHDLHPSKEALDAAIDSGSTSGTAETFEQLDELLASGSVRV